MELFADYHTHSRHSHGEDGIAAHAEVAQERGLEQVGLADHGPGSWWPVGLQGEAGWRRYRDECREVARQTGDVQVLLGVEANVVSVQGDLDVPRRWRKDLDMLLAGLHLEIWPASWRDGAELVLNNGVGKRFSSRLAQRARNMNTKALVECVSRHDVDIVTHPGLKLDIDTAELARACVRKGTALEINSSHEYLNEDYIKIAAKAGVQFAISSDAHRAADVGANEKGLALAKRAGLQPEQVINARVEGGRQRWAID